MLAMMFPGNNRTFLLYSVTAWLYLCLATAMRFSVPSSSSINPSTSWFPSSSG